MKRRVKYVRLTVGELGLEFRKVDAPSVVEFDQFAALAISHDGAAIRDEDIEAVLADHPALHRCNGHLDVHVAESKAGELRVHRAVHLDLPVALNNISRSTLGPFQ